MSYSVTFALTLTYCVFAFLITAFRLFVRGRSRWGWDDCWAAAGALCFLMITVEGGLIAYNFFELLLHHDLLIGLFYLDSASFSFGVWASRLSILYSLRRMAAAPRTIMILRWIMLLFYLSLSAVLSLLIGYCEAHPAWKQSPFPLCPWNSALPAIKISTALLCDALLVILPFVVLVDLRSSPVFRTRLLVIFSASSAMTVSSIVQSISLFSSNATFSFVGGLTENFVALVVCNLSVVIPATIHLLGIGDGLSSPASRRSSASSSSEGSATGGRGSRFTPVDENEDSVAHGHHTINSTFNTMDLRFETSVLTTIDTRESRNVDAKSAMSNAEKNGELKVQSFRHSEPRRTERSRKDQRGESQTRSLPSLSILMARWKAMDVDAADN